MEAKEYCFVEQAGGVNFVVNIKQGEKAKQKTDEFFKALITKESMQIKE